MKTWKKTMVQGEFPIFMALGLQVGPFNVRWTGKRLTDSSVSVAYRTPQRVQDDSGHRTANGENPAKTDSKTETPNFCLWTLPQTLLMWPPSHARWAVSRHQVSELPLSVGKIDTEYASLHLTELKPKQNRLASKQNALVGNRTESRISR